MPVASQLHYFSSGAENHLRPPVILIHGAGGNHLYWPPQIRRMPDQRVFAPDLSGHGKSEGLGQHSIEAYTDEVINFILGLGLTAAVLVGHSMGGAIALGAAIRFPRRVLALGIIGSGAILPVAPRILQGTSDAEAFPSAVAFINDLSFAAESSSRLKELAMKRMAEARPSVLHWDFVACSAFDTAQQLSQIAVPTLILCGAADRMTPPSYSYFLQEHIRGAELELIPNAGHMVMLEQPESVAEKLARFVNRIEYRPGT